jgi:phosphoribosyl 1,2-cyclic phosphodiesterase
MIHAEHPSLFAEPTQPASDPAEGRRSRRRSVPPVPPVPRTSLSLCNLGSGSGGNATLLRRTAADGADELCLIDAGFGPRTLTARMAQAGVDLAQLRSVCVTHFDRDHFKPRWCGLLGDLGVRVFCHRWHLPDLERCRDAWCLRDAGLVEVFDDLAEVTVLPGVVARPYRCQHDRQGTSAFRFDGEGVSIGFATDLGHVPGGLLDHFAGIDLLCIESNYDHGMTNQSSRPTFVNRRNLSDSGHLSNEQARDAVSRIARRGPAGRLREVVLLHRSGQCNHPTKVRKCFARVAGFRDAGFRGRVRQTQPRRRSRWITVKAWPAVRREQLGLRW